ncbi:NAD(P)-dependent dehydrogenase (short-subunit alcohol dehydrogenase family) [Streptomyces sp. SAI-041]|nr:NAD(P)-dependent dehydrogenase (short-subunit alcohol dehydrogenase family) [Streptomyces sp. SAI-041]
MLHSPHAVFGGVKYAAQIVSLSSISATVATLSCGDMQRGDESRPITPTRVSPAVSTAARRRSVMRAQPHRHLREHLPRRAPSAASDIPDQSRRTAVAAGANSGLGLATASELAHHGGAIILAGSSSEPIVIRRLLFRARQTHPAMCRTAIVAGHRGVSTTSRAARVVRAVAWAFRAPDRLHQVARTHPAATSPRRAVMRRTASGTHTCARTSAPRSRIRKRPRSRTCIHRQWPPLPITMVLYLRFRRLAAWSTADRMPTERVTDVLEAAARSWGGGLSQDDLARRHGAQCASNELSDIAPPARCDPLVGHRGRWTVELGVRRGSLADRRTSVERLSCREPRRRIPEIIWHSAGAESVTPGRRLRSADRTGSARRCGRHSSIRP